MGEILVEQNVTLGKIIDKIQWSRSIAEKFNSLKLKLDNIRNYNNHEPSIY